MLNSYKTICIDTSPLVYFFEPNYELFLKEHLSIKILFNSVIEYKLRCIISEVTEKEYLYKHKLKNNYDYIHKYNDFINTGILQVERISKDIEIKANEIRICTNIKENDSVILATAIINECDIFLTNDIRFKNNAAKYIEKYGIALEIYDMKKLSEYLIV